MIELYLLPLIGLYGKIRKRGFNKSKTLALINSDELRRREQYFKYNEETFNLLVLIEQIPELRKVNEIIKDVHNEEIKRKPAKPYTGVVDSVPGIGDKYKLTDDGKEHLEEICKEQCSLFWPKD